jgi:predicted sulfurtransferase
MADAHRIPASAFSRNFGKIREEVYGVGVIEVTAHDRVVGAYISPKELEHFKRLKSQEVRVLHASEIDDDLLGEIETAQYGVISK